MPTKEHLLKKATTFDEGCRRNIIFSFLPISLMLNLTLLLWEIFDLNARPLNLNILRKYFKGMILSLKETVLLTMA